MASAALPLPPLRRTCAGLPPCRPARSRLGRAMLGMLLGTAATPVVAQTADRGGMAEPPIVVTGDRPMALPSRQVIEGDELDSYGAATIGELVEEVSAENGEGNAPVTILINGRRVTGMADIDSYPAEAIERLEILPREAGAASGAPPGQRVIDIVLKPQTRIGTAQGRVRAATDGGTTAVSLDFGATRIRQPQRLNLTLDLSRTGALLESERQLRATTAPATLADARTLVPQRRSYELAFSGADQIVPWLDALATVKLRGTRSEALLGLAGDGAVIARTTTARTLDLTALLGAQRGDWFITLDGSSRFDNRRTATGQAESGDTTRSRVRASELNFLGTGPLLHLPAGEAQLTLGGSLRRDSVRFDGLAGSGGGFVRHSRNGRVGIDLPLTGPSGPLPWLGTLALRAEASRGTSGGIDTRADTATLRWAPAPWLQVTGLASSVATAPNVSLMNEPMIETPGVRYFDPLRGETVEVVAVGGGRTDLPRQRIASRSLTVDVRPLRSVDLLLTGEYARTSNTNVISALPPASTFVLDLFPDRFGRDATGQLVRVDLSPVIFPSQRERQLRASANLSVPLGESSRRPRLQVSASLRTLLGSRLTLPDGSAIDLLGRSGVALGGAMRPRNRFDFTLGYAERGLGVRLTGERRGVSYLGSEGADLLTFAPLTTLNLRAFVEGQRIAPSSDILRRARLSLDIGNLANRRETVRDGAGATPLAFQPVFRDPVGRTVEVDLRIAF